MPVPDAAGNGHYRVVKRVGFVAVGLGGASESFGPADGVFNFDAAAGVGAIIGALRLCQGRSRAFFGALGSW